MSYSSSRAITSSTMSCESAPRSSMQDACGVTWSSLTPSCSQMIPFPPCSTLAAMSILLAITPSPGSHVQSTVHVQDLARHVARGGRAEVRDRLRHVLGTGDPSDRHQGGVRHPLG